MQEDNMQPLPPELDWNNMKDGIFEKIRSIEQEESSLGSNKYSWKRIGLFLLVFFASIICPFSIVHNMIKNQGTAANAVAQLPKLELYKSVPNKPDKAPLTNQIGHSIEAPVKKDQTTQAKDLLLTNKKSEPTQAPKNLESPRLNSNPLADYQHLREPDVPNNFFNTDRIESAESTLTLTQNALTPLAEISYLNSSLPTLVLKSLATEIFDQVCLEEIKQSVLDSQKIDRVYLPRIRHSKFPNQLILEGGIVFWDEGYGNNLPERAQYETPLPSFQLQGHYRRSFGKNYFLLAGLQYQQLESKFEYNNTIPDYKVTIKDTIIQVQNNLLSGQQTIIYGDVVESVQAERRIRHYNTTKLFKLSTAVGKSWRFNSFQTDVYLGGALNSWVHNQGRSFYQGTIIDYHGASNSMFQNQWLVDATFGVRVHYFLNQNIGLTTGFQAQKSLMNWSNQAGINFYPVSFGLQFGLSYSLE